MKKFLIMLVMAVLIIALTACGAKKNDTENARTKYDLEVDIGKDISFREKVVFTNTYADGLDSLVFNLYANAYAYDAVHKAYKGNLLKYGGIEILGAKVNGADAGIIYSDDRARMSVSIPEMKMGDSVELQFTCLVTVPEGRFRLGKYKDVLNCGNFYPVLAVYENGKFREDSFSYFGDPFYSSCADYKMKFTCPENTFIACSGDIIAENVSNNTRRITAEASNVRDIAFCASEKFKTVSKTAGNGVAVKYYYYNDKTPEASAATAVNALEKFSAAFVNYPYKTYTVVETPFEHGGMEYPTLVYISSELKDNTDVIIHETAHQWWYGIVGNDAFKDAYIDEGLATFCEAYYYLLDGDKETFDSKMKDMNVTYRVNSVLLKKDANYSASLQRNLSQFTENEYNLLCYNRSAMMFNNLYELAGKECFEKSLKQFCTDNYMNVADTGKLIEAFNASCGRDMGGIILSWVDGRTQDTFYSYSNGIPA